MSSHYGLFVVFFGEILYESPKKSLYICLNFYLFLCNAVVVYVFKELSPNDLVKMSVWEKKKKMWCCCGVVCVVGGSVKSVSLQQTNEGWGSLWNGLIRRWKRRWRSFFFLFFCFGRERIMTRKSWENEVAAGRESWFIEGSFKGGKVTSL